MQCKRTGRRLMLLQHRCNAVIALIRPSYCRSRFQRRRRWTNILIPFSHIFARLLATVNQTNTCQPGGWFGLCWLTLAAGCSEQPDWSSYLAGSCQCLLCRSEAYTCPACWPGCGLSESYRHRSKPICRRKNCSLGVNTPRNG